MRGIEVYVNCRGRQREREREREREACVLIFPKQNLTVKCVVRRK